MNPEDRPYYDDDEQQANVPDDEEEPRLDHDPRDDF